MAFLDQFIGNDEVCNELKIICDMLKHPEQYNSFNSKHLNGILLYGETGVGKTFLAQTFMKELGWTPYYIRQDCSADLFLSHLKDTFLSAAQTAPSAILVENLDKLLMAYEKNECLIVLEGCFDILDDKDVLVIATAETIDDIPDSLLRSGRLGLKFELSVPTYEEICEIVEGYLSSPNFDPGINSTDVAKMLWFFSFAEIKEVFNRAAIYARHEEKSLVSMKHIVRAFLLCEYSCLYNDFDDFEQQDEEIYSEFEKKLYHEAGHLVSLEIMAPGGIGLAYTYPGDNGFVKRSCLFESFEQEIIFRLAGIAAEEIQFGSISEGSYCDIECALSELKTAAVKNAMFGGSYLSPLEDKISTFQLSYQEMAIKHEYNSYLTAAKQMLIENRKLLDAVVKELRQKHILLNSDVQRIVDQISST